MSIKDDMTGAAILYDWLGDGKAVDTTVAEARAACCVLGNGVNPCHLNVEPNWWERNFKEPIAQWMRAELGVKNGMKLHVSVEQQLHVCRLCGCCLPLKVWTPPSHLHKHISKEKLEQAPVWCWLRKELL